MDATKKQDICNMYLTGAAILDICVEHGIQAPQMYKVLREEGIPLRGHTKYDPSLKMGSGRGPGSFNADAIRMIVADYEVGGLSGRQISEHRKIPYSRVLRILRDARIQVLPGPRGQKWNKVRDEIAADIDAGDLTLEKIMEKWGITARALYYIVQKMYPDAKEKGQRLGKVEAIVQEVLIRMKKETKVNPDQEPRQLPLFSDELVGL